LAVLFVVNVGVGVLRTTSHRTQRRTLPLPHITPKFCTVAVFVAVDFYKTFIVSLADLGGRAVYGGSLAGAASSNPAAGMDVCLLCMLCVVRYRSLYRADHSSRGVLPSVVCMSVIVKPR